jgi:sugar/nucleoside kinase (ribokinase family)
MTYDVLGIGSPLLDITINIEDKDLASLDFKKGSSMLISQAESENILKILNGSKQWIAPGGSVQNTLSGLAALGNHPAFLGVIGDDKHGRDYSRLIGEAGITSFLQKNENFATGHSIILITPDGERTMATCLGAALAFNKNQISEEQIENSRILHLEAYQLEDEVLREAVLRAIGIAKKAGVLISLDLSDAGLVCRNKLLFKQIVKDHINILFANETEAKEFTDKDGYDALKAISNNCDIAIVKLGEKGSLIKTGDEIFQIEPVKVEVINTNGAGDTYAAGILHGILNQLDLKSAGDIASHISALTVASQGATMDKKHFDKIAKYKI